MKGLYKRRKNKAVISDPTQPTAEPTIKIPDQQIITPTVVTPPQDEIDNKKKSIKALLDSQKKKIPDDIINKVTEKANKINEIGKTVKQKNAMEAMKEVNSKIIASKPEVTPAEIDEMETKLNSAELDPNITKKKG